MAHVAVGSRASGLGQILPAGSSLAQVESTPKVTTRRLEVSGELTSH